VPLPSPVPPVITPEPPLAAAPDAGGAADADDKADFSRIRMGLRAGVALGFYTMAHNELTAKMGVPVSTTFNFSYFFTRNIGLSMELGFDRDQVNYSWERFDTKENATLTVNALQTAILFKAAFTPAVTLSPFAGVYVAIPLGGIESSDGSQYKYSTVFGMLAGGSVGIQLWGGSLFLDARYGFDFTPVSAGSNALALYSRQRAVFSMGYELWL
jgi:hypothetical protein